MSKLPPARHLARSDATSQSEHFEVLADELETEIAERSKPSVAWRSTPRL